MKGIVKIGAPHIQIVDRSWEKIRPADCWLRVRVDARLKLPLMVERFGGSLLLSCVGEIACNEVGLGGRCFECRY